MEESLSVLASIASILAAIFAFRQAKKAKDYADMAKSQVSDKRAISELSRLTTKCESIIKALSEYGPSAVEANLRGKIHTGVAREVQELVQEITASRNSLKGISDLEQRVGRLGPQISNFATSVDPPDLKQHGSILLNELTDLNAAISSLLIDKRETLVLN